MEKKASMVKILYLFYLNVKLHMKATFPWYIGVSSGFFAVLLPFVLGCDTYEDLGVIMDRNFSFISIVAFADIYYIEFQQKTEEVFYLFPNKRIKHEIVKRVCLRLIVIFLLLLLSCYLFALKGLHLNVNNSLETVIAQGIFAVISSIVFFGGISCLSVNVLRNLWKGVGISIVVWIILGSKWGETIPDFANVFAYGEMDRNWIQGKCFGLFAGTGMLLLSAKFAEKSPCR
jgi:ABC-type transport system involved in multi-copper enzyme maturation permease subunit